ncbi:MAG TPA: hypothetical protein VEZ90_10585 [Blastocatellia bacterium]|nr:hypothetical protein [Blastocatellia bacterium]
MAIANAAQLEPVLRESVFTTLTKMYEERRPLTKRIPKAPDDLPMNSRGVRFPLDVIPNASFGWFGEGGNYPVAGFDTKIECKAYPTQNGSGFSFTGTWFREARQKSNFADTLTQELARWQTSALKKMEQAFTSSSTGQVGVVVSVNTGANQITFATSYAQGSFMSNRKVLINGRYQIFSASGTQRVGGLSSPFTITCSARTVSTGVTTFNAVPSDAVATDIAVYEGSWNSAMQGLPDIINNVGTIQGLARTSYPEALNADVEDCGGAPISATRFEKHKGALMFRVEQENVKLSIVWSVAQPQKYKMQGYGQIRYQEGGGTYRGEFKDVAFYDWEKIESTDLEDSDIYGVYWDDLMRFDMKPFGPYDEDGMPWRLNFASGSASDAFTGWFGWQGQIAAKRFNAAFRMKNLDVSGASVGYLSLNN